MRGWVTPLSRLLNPSGWKWQLDFQGYPLVANNSRLALKVFIDGPSRPLLRENIPQDQRDSPYSKQDDLFSFIHPVETEFEEDASDKGYFNWGQQGVEIGGIPEKTAIMLNSWTRERSVRVVNSGVLTEDLDFDPLPSTIDSITKLGKLAGEVRSYMYFSFMVTRPDRISWDPFVGLDEDDYPEQQVSTGVRTELSYPFFVTLIILSFLINRN